MLYIYFGSKKQGIPTGKYSGENIHGIIVRNKYKNCRRDSEDDKSTIIETPERMNVLPTGMMKEFSIHHRIRGLHARNRYEFVDGYRAIGFLGEDDGRVSAIIVDERRATQLWTNSNTGEAYISGNVRTVNCEFCKTALVFIGLQPGSTVCFSRSIGPTSGEVLKMYTFGPDGLIVEKCPVKIPDSPKWRQLERSGLYCK